MLFPAILFSQNSLVGDGFGGRKWYEPTNFAVGSYSGYSICYDESPNQLYGWGNNSYNQLGLGIGVPGVHVPTAIPNMSDVKYFSAGYIMGGIKNDNTGWVWGNPILGYPVQVITDAYFLDASSATISFVKNDGTVWSIGHNFYGQFGDGSNTDSYQIPKQMLGVTNAVRVANSPLVTIILKDDSTLMATGTNWSGALGINPLVQQTNTPLPIVGIPKILDIKSHATATIALAENGDVYFWGQDGIFGLNHTPIKLPFSNIVAISGCDDGFAFLVLDENKNCYSWGQCNFGQCGFLPIPNPTTPILVATDVVDIMVGEWFSYIVKSDGSMWASGMSQNWSIWLNLPDTQSHVFKKVDLSSVPEACPIVFGKPEPIILKDSIFFPNVFSPNGDASNDIFYFPTHGVELLQCQIYNRWGSKVYEFNEVNDIWDGRTTAGKECNTGTYYFIVNYKMATSDDWFTHKGSLSLLR